MSNRAGTYLKRVLTDTQYAAYRRLTAHDSRDSQARKHWRYLERMEKDYPRTNTERQEAVRAWLQKWGYMAADGARLGPGPSDRRRT